MEASDCFAVPSKFTKKEPDKPPKIAVSREANDCFGVPSKFTVAQNGLLVGNQYYADSHPWILAGRQGQEDRFVPLNDANKECTKLEGPRPK